MHLVYSLYLIHPPFIYANHLHLIATTVLIVSPWTVNCIIKTMYKQTWKLLDLLPRVLNFDLFPFIDFCTVLYRKNSKTAFIQITSKDFLKLPKLDILLKGSILSQKLGFQDLLPIANLIYLHYSTTQRYCLLHLIKQNSLLKTFLRTLILMIQLSLYLFPLLELIWNCIIFLLLFCCCYFCCIWSWFYSSGGSKKLWAWIFIHTSWTLRVSERVLFSRLLEGLIGGPHI